MNETCEQIEQHLVDTNRIVKKELLEISVKHTSYKTLFAKITCAVLERGMRDEKEHNIDF